MEEALSRSKYYHSEVSKYPRRLRCPTIGCRSDRHANHTCTRLARVAAATARARPSLRPDASEKATTATAVPVLRCTEVGAACAGEASEHAGSSTPRFGLNPAPSGPTISSVTVPLGTSVRLFLADGDPDGLWIVEKSNWTGVGLVIPRPIFTRSGLLARSSRDRDIRACRPV